MLKIVKEDIWAFRQKGWVVVVPTNGHVNKDGKGVMGKGLAYQARKLYKNLDSTLGNLLKKHGNTIFYFDRQGLVTFPTKDFWRDASNPALINKSCVALKVLMDRIPSIKVAMPKVGCGAGQLTWERVRPMIEEHFGTLPHSRFLIVDNNQGDAGRTWRGSNKEDKSGRDDANSPPRII